VKALFITEKGQRLLIDAGPAVGRVNERILGRLSLQERALFIALLDKVAGRQESRP
jgi:DNA-binding MarR family transcriptional regulator